MNIYGVKIGDIFCLESSGSSGHHSKFFQVISIKGKKQIVIREIDKKEVSHGMVMPIKDEFLNDSIYVKENIGDIKNTKIRDEKRYSEDSKIYIAFNYLYFKNKYDGKITKHVYYDDAYLWKGSPKKDLLEWLD